ncbi:hypothetical protein BOTBODRAFT_134940 [Botryobasidium botryosum FD-172 SS1]|uniref:Bacteriophage T5 Orf172 DNA-binding domain-containing protein n=1 Tax=Botryobasidium botryosum (strain FD-172 SS1) TaxID=930990 RepID=A0A067MA05_BOTB1|nr:hypothetical protein BOTBODRAFT_134940 [Botryobasidium botryosum FD-172 SS1]
MPHKPGSSLRRPPRGRHSDGGAISTRGVHLPSEPPSPASEPSSPEITPRGRPHAHRPRKSAPAAIPEDDNDSPEKYRRDHGPRPSDTCNAEYRIPQYRITLVQEAFGGVRHTLKLDTYNETFKMRTIDRYIDERDRDYRSEGASIILDRQVEVSTPLPTAPEAPPSSSSPHDQTQCSGITKSTNPERRCLRFVTTVHPLSLFSPGVPIKRYCFHHTKESTTGFYSRVKPNEWIKFEDWVPEYLIPETKTALRVEMEKAVSAKDEPGYIYAYETRSKSPQHVHLKVGRAINLNKRIDEWSKQCGPDEVRLRGWWPGGLSKDTSLLSGRLNAGNRGKYCHRLERLVHLELADLSYNGQYLAPDFPINVPSQSRSAGLPRAPKSPSKAKLVREPCSRCNEVHIEIFTFSRVTAGKLERNEWDSIVRPIIEKWGRFVEDYV